MKKFFLVLITFFMISPAFSMSSYLVVDIDGIVTKSIAYTEFKKRWDSTNVKYQKEIEVYEKKIEVLDKMLLAKFNAIDAQELQKSRRLIGEYEKKIHQIMQQRTMVLDKAMAEALDILRQNISLIVSEYATSYKANLILSTSQVVYYNNNIDITQRVLNRLDNRLKEINVEIQSVPE